MLTDEIKKSIKQLKQLDVIETAVQDAEKKAKNDNDFAILVTNFTTSIKNIFDAKRDLNYELSGETLQYAEDTIKKLEDVISAGVVDESELISAKQHIKRKVNPNLSKEWEEFHQKKTSGVSGKLATIGSLVQNRTQIARINSHIDRSNDWNDLSLADDGKHTRLELLKSSMDEVDQMEENLNLSDEIKDFVSLVTYGRAKVTDLNSRIVDWMIQENLVDKFVVDFKKS